MDVLTSVSESHFDDSHVFRKENGFNIAIAVVDSYSLLGNPLFIDPTYGSVKFKFAYDENQDFVWSSEEVESHVCSTEELEQEFFPIH